MQRLPKRASVSSYGIVIQRFYREVRRFVEIGSIGEFEPGYDTVFETGHWRLRDVMKYCQPGTAGKCFLTSGLTLLLCSNFSILTMGVIKALKMCKFH